MHRAALAVAAFALLVACENTVTPVEPTLVGSRSIASASANSATTVTTNEQIDVTLFVFVPCANGGAGEVISVSGPLHVLTHTTISNSGMAHVKQHFQPQGLSGEGFTTGDKYQGTGVTQEEFNVDLRDGAPQTDTFINNFRMIGQGPDNNYLVHENFHVTVNANGEVTTVVDNFSVTCK